MTEHQGNLRHMSYIVNALRSLYKSDHHADLCSVLLKAACWNLSNKYPMRGFDSINFHLPRHLSWKCKTFGPFWTNSATQFESANHHMIRLLKGIVNTCWLLVISEINCCIKLLLKAIPCTSELLSEAFRVNDAYSMKDTPLLIELKKKFSFSPVLLSQSFKISS